MPLTSPNLDDRTWDQLMVEAKQRIRHACPQWTDLTAHDPGMVLLEGFAYLCEAMIYRLNRVPDKMYVEFLRLLGVELQPPRAATVRLLFRRERDSDGPLSIPRGTRVTIKRTPGLSEPPVFSTLDDVVLPAGDPEESQLEVQAIHANLVEGELVGHGNGQPGQWLRVKHPPIVEPVEADPMNLVVGVAIDPSHETGGGELLAWGGRHFQRWKEVDRFHDRQQNERVSVTCVLKQGTASHERRGHHDDELPGDSLLRWDRIGRYADRRPQWFLIMLAPIPAIMIENYLSY